MAEDLPTKRAATVDRIGGWKGKAPSAPPAGTPDHERYLLRLLRCQFHDPRRNGEDGLDRNGRCSNRITHATVLIDWHPEVLAGCDDHIVSLCRSASAFAVGIRRLDQLVEIKLPELP